MASPPCGITYGLVDAPDRLSKEILEKINLTVVGTKELREIHVFAPGSFNGMKFRRLALSVIQDGTKKLMVDVEPYFHGSEHVSFILNIEQNLFDHSELNIVYDFHEECKGVQVASQGFKFPLAPAITMPSN